MTVLMTLLLSVVFVYTGLAAEGVDAQLPPYNKVSGVSGSINSVGSDTMNNLMTLWCEGFSKHYPNVKCQIEGKGSSTAPPALIAATAQLGPMSRAMKSSESDEFEKKFGYKPTQIKSALDSLAIYVHKDNPIAGLTIDQADAIFSKTKKCGATQDIKTWGQLAMTGDWTNRPISIYGRNSASGTYAFFKEHAMCKGDFKDEVKEQPGSASVVQGITEDRYAIGYSGIGYKTSGVRTLPLASKKGEPYKEPSYANVINGSYPLARFLYIYVNKAPKKPLDPLISEFIKYILSAEGQKVVVKDGYDPLPEKIVRAQLKELE
ncbi:PstS family phosphate ABC transporter substrate-binding protein [Candidatus Magnetobacterium casensis]|uniref:Phosphate-binding protein n=1 Tax=Candidatus Magnetobacterium casense TaxID=1455061 RepID=A0ABS6RVV3_9BACT|nr:PstS family phosphate ABC transporter substrate-binding protein [Candidatus Magnetobacterium casensis]